MKRLLSLIVAAMLITAGTMAREEVTIDKDNCTITKNGEGQFMTTAEISDKLVSWGSIKKPMSMSRLGMVNANRNIEGRG
jgi:hypothetical protein